MNKLLRTILTLLMVFSLLLPGVLGPIGTVYANDEETDKKEEEETSEDKDDTSEDSLTNRGGAENVFDGLDEERIGDILGKLSYDERVQYLVTYAILSGDYISKSAYSNLFSSGGTPSGATDGMNLNGLQMGIDNIIMGQKIGATPEEEKDLQKDKDTTAEAIAERDKVLEEVINYLTKMVMNVYIAENNMVRAKDLSSTKEIGGVFDLGVTMDIVSHPMNYTAPVKGDIMKYNFPHKGDAYTQLERYVKEELGSVIKGSKYKGDITSVKNIDSFLNLYNAVIDVNHIETKILDPLAKGFTKLKLSVHDVQMKDTGIGGFKYKTEYYIPYNKTVASGKAKGEFNKIIGLYSMPTKFISNSEKITYTEARKKRQEGLKREAKDSVNKALGNDKFKKNVEKVYALTRDNGLGSAGSKEEAKSTEVRGLGWLPLIPKYDTEYMDRKGSKSFVELIKGFDGGIYETNTGQVYTSDVGGRSGKAYKGRRLLQLNDIVNVEAKEADGNKYSANRRASPYITFNYDEDIKSPTKSPQLTMGDSGALNREIIQYAGFKVTGKNYSAWDEFKTGVTLGFFGPKGTFGRTEPLSGVEIGKHKTNGQSMIAHANSLSKVAKRAGSVGDMSLGIDNYGNVINGETLGVVIPYWQNRLHTTLASVSTNTSQMLSSPALRDVDMGAFKVSSPVTVSMSEATTTIGDTKLFDTTEVDKMNVELGSIRIKEYSDYLSKMEQTDSRKALAMAIVSKTKVAVERFNEDFIKIAEKEKELYLSESTARNANDDGLSKDEFDLLSLQKKIMAILDGSFYDIMRKTIAAMVADFYTKNISNYGVNSIFYTELVSDTPMWLELLPLMLKLVIGFSGLYLVYASFKVIRKTLKIGDVAKQFLAITLIVLIPTVIYSPVVHLAINNPTQKIVGKQMEQMSMVDSYMAVGKEYKERDPLYKKLFNSSESLRDRTEDYLVDIYTTEHVDGFDIKDTIGGLDFENSLSNSTLFKRDVLGSGGTWRKQDIVKVRVSIFDLFEWVVEDGELSLFDWLASEKSEAYEGISQYTEYSEDTSVMYNGLGVNISGVEMTASDIYRKLYRMAVQENIEDNISGLYGVTSAFRQRNTKEGEGLTDREREAFVRDLALTGDVREDIYGGRTKVSPQTEEVMARYSTKIGSLNLENDFFNVGPVLDELIQYRDMQTTTADGDIYDINRGVLDDYITNLSVVREAVNTDHNGYKQSEYHMVMLRIWFEMNKVLGVKFFPTDYGVDTISMDSYMRLIYVPMADYFSVDTKDVDNVGEYLVLRAHPIVVLLIFLPALILLFVFGLLYQLVFYVLLMVISAVALFYNHVIKGNHNNKAMLGTLYIILSFGLVKIGLLIIWRIMSFALNYSYVVTGGSVYPYMLVHSLIILVYLFYALKFLWQKVIGSVIKDKANLGGEVMTEGLKKSADKVMGTMRGVANGELVGKGMSEAGGAVNNVLGREGLKSGLTKASKTASFTGGAIVGGASALASSKINPMANVSVKESVGFIASSLKNKGKAGTNGVMSKIRVFNRKGEPVDLNSSLNNDMKNVNGASPVNEGLFEDYDKIKPTESVGLSEADQEKLNKDLGTHLKADDGMVMMDTKSEKSAESMVNHLKNMGIEAYQKGTSVLYKTSEYKMANSSDRKSLLGGLIRNLTDEMLSLSTTYTSSKVKNAMNYTETASGLLNVGVNTAGIATQNLGNLLKSETLRKNFIVKEEPTLTPNGYLQGNLTLMPKNSNQDNHKLMTELFKQDELLREQNNITARAPLHLDREIDLQGADVVEGHIMSTKLDGMSYQNGKLMYDSNNKDHVAYAENIVNTLNTELDQERTEREQLAVRATSQVVHGGDSGFTVTSIDASEAGQVLNEFGVQSTLYDTAPVFYGGKYAESTAQHLEKVMAESKTANLDNKTYLKQNENYINNVYKGIGQANNLTPVEHESMKLNNITSVYMTELQNNPDKRAEYKKLRDIKTGLTNLDKESPERQKEKVAEYEEMLKILSGTGKKYNELMLKGTEDLLANKDVKVSSEMKESIQSHLERNGMGTQKGGRPRPTSPQAPLIPEVERSIKDSNVDFRAIKDVQVMDDGRIVVNTDGRVNEKDLEDLVKRAIGTMSDKE